MTPTEQLTAWAKEGFYVSLAINDGHEKDTGKASYCLSVGNDDGWYELGDNDIHGSLEEAVAAILAAPWEEYEDEPTIDLNQQAEVCEVNGKPQMTIFDSLVSWLNGAEYVIKHADKETDA